MAQWEGWPHRDAIPSLPKLTGAGCETCGGTERLSSARIRWFNYHGPYNTGLPDYWLLKVDEGPEKWGSPFYAESRCERCGEVAVVSQMRFPNGSSELMLNCSRCGAGRVISAPEA